MGFEDANRLLGGSRDPIISFKNIGDSVTGTLLDAEIVPITDPSGTVQKDDQGRVREQIVYTLQTDLRDPNDEEDTGKRRVYAKWAIQRAISDALSDLGLSSVGLQEGGKITITHDRTTPAKTRGYSDAKLFTVEYAPPPARGLASKSEPESPWENNTDSPSADVDAEKRKLVETLHSQGTPIELIAAATKLSQKQVESVLSEMAF